MRCAGLDPSATAATAVCVGFGAGEVCGFSGGATTGNLLSADGWAGFGAAATFCSSTRGAGTTGFFVSAFGVTVSGFGCAFGGSVTGVAGAERAGLVSIVAIVRSIFGEGAGVSGVGVTGNGDGLASTLGAIAVAW